MSEVSVVGAGPAGCLAARELAKENNVTLFEEHRVQPVSCAGVISKSGLERLGIKGEDFVLNRVTGAKIYSPSGNLLEVDGRETKAYVVDRREFDNHLLTKAIDSGVTLINEKVTKIGDSVSTKSKKVMAEKVVLATGTDYALSKQLDLDTPKRFLVGAQYEMDVECDSDFVELHFVVPDFFAWVVPLNGSARVGLCTTKDPLGHLDSFVRKLKSAGRIRNQKIIDKNFGVIPVYDPGIKTVNGKILLTGDAAGHVKATTGGGIIPGGIAGKLTASDDYEASWRREIGRELYLHLLIRKFMDRLSPAGMDLFISTAREGRNSIETKGDMDVASRTLSAMMKNPRFMTKFLLNTPRFFIDILT